MYAGMYLLSNHALCCWRTATDTLSDGTDSACTAHGAGSEAP